MLDAVPIHAALSNDNKEPFAPLYIPLAGPWITMSSSHPDASGTFGLALLGVGQAVGAGLLITGLASSQEKLVRNDVGKSRFTITPMIARGSYGLGASVSF